jgi:hypothetical protein
MAHGVSLITLFAGPQGDALVIEHDDERGIVVSAQSAGVEVELCIPPARWFPMARQIYDSRSSLTLFQLANDR